MIRALKTLFDPEPAMSEEAIQQQVRLVAAAMLIETARADFAEDAAERDTMEVLLCSVLALPPEKVRDLIAAAAARVDASTSLYEFTRVINDHYSAGQKLRLIEAMWAVAYADGDLDKYEEHLIRKVAELTYVPHADYIRAKLEASAG
ncbi:TerB family tellurite resistance protein [Mangrovimicrobium sediminis]|uniref:TerB family tellurite resistance protein n=1 Tax=Mangrovimicrobium sediminis TaxID=2562682 RepID=A0A4Z0M623_9GAMM|nr:TerB family tellurite resistance protein [Haliea sp. SAOS-164]TGD74857.1 TerB family tellurite resistance protein [Haliea sp. SAOS-164]